MHRDDAVDGFVWCTPLYFARQTGWSIVTVKLALTNRQRLGGQSIQGAELNCEPGLLGAVKRWRIPVSEIERLRRK